MDATAIARNQELQRQWYGAPLGELCRELRALFGTTQSGLAEILGISPAMLSLVMRGQRARIANPDAAARLSALLHLAHELRSGALGPGALPGALEEIRTSRTPGQDSLGAVVTGHQPAADRQSGTEGDADLRFAVRLRELLTARAGAVELLAAAALLDTAHPGLAEILRTCGTGRTDEAVDLVRRLTGPPR